MPIIPVGGGAFNCMQVIKIFCSECVCGLGVDLEETTAEVRIANADDDRAKKLVRPWLAHIWIHKVSSFIMILYCLLFRSFQIQAYFDKFGMSFSFIFLKASSIVCF